MVAEATLFVNVGGAGECGFLSIAAGIIDNTLTHPEKNALFFDSLLEHHCDIFGEAKASNAVDYLKQLSLKKQAFAQFLVNFAYTLRQIAVKEICERPEYYPGAIIKKHEGTAPDDMRKANTWVDESALAALANAIQIPLSVRYIQSQKVIPLVLHYGVTDKSSINESNSVVIQLEDEHYIPKVSQKSVFEGINRQPVSIPAPNTNIHAEAIDMPALRKRVQEETDRLLKVYENNVTRLSHLSSSGELTQDDLLSIYIKGMDRSDYLKGRVKYVGFEHGNQNFFEEAINAAKNAASLNRHSLFAPPEKQKFVHDSVIKKELIHAIARAISIGDLNEDRVYEEKPSFTAQSLGS